MKKRLIEYLKAFNEKLHNFLLNPLSILLIIIIIIWLMRTNYTLPLTDVYIHLSFLIVCISFYTYHLATNDFIRDLLILGSITDFKNRKEYYFGYYDILRTNSREKGRNYFILLCFILWCYFGYMNDLIYKGEFIEKRLNEMSSGSIGFTTLILPIALTILFNVYHQSLHDFLYGKYVLSLIHI